MRNIKTDRDELTEYLANFLDISHIKDYSPNGLQVEGKRDIVRIVTGVTASLALIDAAQQWNADAILVHHGYFWRGEDARVIGQKHKRLKSLLISDTNLYAYHLPLDMHPEIGNNAQLACQLGLQANGRFGEDALGWMGVAASGIRTVADMAQLVAERLGRTPLVIGDPGQSLGRVGWCTGAAQNMLGDAIAAGVQTYMSGEISEPTVHLAREAGVAYLACGHHATERYGIQALGQHLARQFGVEHRFIDIDNPV